MRDAGIVTGATERMANGTPKDHGPDPHPGDSAEIQRRGREKVKAMNEEIKATAAKVKAMVEANDAKHGLPRKMEELWQ